MLTTFLAVVLTVAAAANDIRLNSIGYLPDAQKQAKIASSCTNFSVIRTRDGATMIKGAVSGPVTNTDTRETLYTADFSGLAEPGEYRLNIDGHGNSIALVIGEKIYREPFRTVTRGMYLWRCGTAVSGEHDGNIFAHGVCHTNPASLEFAENGSGLKSASGGWHDAGDYNKYVVNAGITVGTMFRAWEDFGAAIRRVPLNTPETGGRHPDFLTELKWELDWLFTMQAPDGSVYHKLTTKDFCGFIMPEDETDPQYFTSWSSAATADFVAMMAAAARYFRASDAGYAERCLKAAQLSYAFLQAHPDNHNADLREFKTGAYATRDSDDRLWAAAELWETMGAGNVLRDFEERARANRSLTDIDFDWQNVKNLGLITYLFSQRTGKDPSLEQRIRESLLSAADQIVRTRNEHGYHRPLGTRYYWGCNGGVARQVIVLYSAHRLSPKPEYRETALDALNHLFGRNPYGRSFVTGVGYNPPMHPHDRRSSADDMAAPWPGYLVGGPNRGALSWEDVQTNYRCNEIAINWNAALIYALAAFLNEEQWNESRLARIGQPHGESMLNGEPQK